jgi:hypothetical protein
MRKFMLFVTLTGIIIISFCKAQATDRPDPIYYLEKIYNVPNPYVRGTTNMINLKIKQNGQVRKIVDEYAEKRARLLRQSKSLKEAIQQLKQALPDFADKKLGNANGKTEKDEQKTLNMALGYENRGFAYFVHLMFFADNLSESQLINIFAD